MSNIRNMTDEKLWELVLECTNQPAGGTAQSQQEKQLHLGLTELSLRSQKALNESITALDTSSEKYSRTIVRLTWVLIVLTAVLLLLTIPMALAIT